MVRDSPVAYQVPLPGGKKRDAGIEDWISVPKPELAVAAPATSSAALGLVVPIPSVGKQVKKQYLSLPLLFLLAANASSYHEHHFRAFSLLV